MESIKGQPIGWLIRWLGLGYGGFLIYGSLMPFQFQLQPLSEAWVQYLAGHGAGGSSLSWHDFITNIALYLPIGFLGAGGWPVSPRRGAGTLALLSIVVVGCLLSAGIEFLQLHFPPRVSLGYDLLGNGLGTILGYLAWRGTETRLLVLHAKCVATQGMPLNFSWPPRLGVAFLVAYLLGLTLANKWYEGAWLGWQEAMIRWPSIHFLPFYYHQEASTWIALSSVLWNFALYIPVGAGLRVWASAGWMRGKPRLMAVGAGGALVATVIEAGKLFVASRHPDSGNVVIAVLAAVVGFIVLPVCLRLAKSPTTSNTSIDMPLGSSLPPIRLASLVALGVMMAVLGVAASFPVMPLLLTSFLVAYAYILRRWQHAWLWVLPVALPVLDLAPYSGWFFLDEFDLFVLITLAVSNWQRQGGNILEVRKGPGYWLSLIFALSTAISLVIGLWPLQPIDLNAFSHYFSHYNALRVAKGIVWALLLARLLATNPGPEGLATRRLSVGIVIGLAGAAALAVWERAVYPGLWNFASQFRIGAFFSSMHNGGSHIEAYFVMAMPFALVNLYSARNRPLRFLLAALFLISGYVLLVTFARGGYAAFALAILIVAASIFRAAPLEKRRKTALALVGLMLISFLMTLPVLFGTFAQQRLGATDADLGVRQSHWGESLRLIKPDLINSVFGMGLGRFPETYYFGNKDGGMPALFRYGQDAGNSFLTLGTGDPLYVEQVTNVSAGQNYRLSLDTKNTKSPGIINVLLCERTYFYSYGCVSATLKHQTAPGKWEHHEAELYSGELGKEAGLGRRAVKLSLENTGSGTIDVDNVELRNEQGANLVVNGSFEDGHSNWFFSSPFNHLPWHIKNLWIGLLFDQGWFGVLAFAGLVAFACFTLARAAWNGDLHAGASMAAAAGFLCVGLFDSLFDAPRLITLFFLILALPGTLCTRRKADTGTFRQDLTRTPQSGLRVPGELSSSLSGKAKSAEAPSDGHLGYTSPLELVSPSSILHGALGALVLAAAIGAVTHLPFVPYNLRALPNPFHPLLAPVILAISLYWVLATPAWTARWLKASPLARFVFPGWVILHGVVAWALVRNAVLPVMIHKVAGSPVLNWSWEWETLIRFGVLEGTFFMLLSGGAVMATTIVDRGKPKALIAWLFWAIFLLPISHFIIVTNAATDNLVELMAEGGSVVASLLIASWIVGIGMGGEFLARWVANRGAGGWRQLLPALIFIPLGYVIVGAALEPSVQKFGQVFSGLQFLLSIDRAHYASGWDLWLRYCIFHGALLCAAALAQYPLWLNARK